MTGAEFADDAIAFALWEVAMDAGDASGFQAFGKDFVEFIGTAFGAGEDDDLAGFFAGEDANEEREFAIFVDGYVELFDGIDDDAVFGEVDGLWFDHILLGEPHDIGGHGGGEQEGLAVGGAGAEDAFDIGSEADIEHAVGFIENGDCEVVEVQVAAAHEVLDASWGADNDLGTVAEIFNLFAHGSAAHGESEADGGIFGEFAGFGADLFAEFAGWGEYEDLDFLFVGVDLFESWEHEGGRFSGACAGLSDAVFAGESDGNEGCLDGAGGFVADFPERAECGFRESKVFEGRGILSGVFCRVFQVGT